MCLRGIPRDKHRTKEWRDSGSCSSIIIVRRLEYYDYPGKSMFPPAHMS
jgi:hypothetical protein